MSKPPIAVSPADLTHQNLISDIEKFRSQNKNSDQNLNMHGHPKTSSNPPGIRLKHLLSQLSILDSSVKRAVLQEFTLFLKLPLELRRKIWSMETDERRAIKLSFTLDEKEWTDVFFINCTGEGTAQGPVPAILQTSAESRTEALRYFTPLYDKRLKHNIYINLNRDFLIMTEHHVKKALRMFRRSQQQISATISPSLLSSCWNLDKEILEKLNNVRILATSKWGSLAVPEFSKCKDLINLLTGVTYVMILSLDRVFEKQHMATRTPEDEGYLFRTLILIENRQEMKKEVDSRITQDQSLSSRFRTANRKCHANPFAKDGDCANEFDLYLEADLEPVELVDGYYKVKGPKYIEEVAGTLDTSILSSGDHGGGSG